MALSPAALNPLRLWSRWVAWCGRQEDVRPLALVRVLVPLTILLDQLNVARLGLLSWFYVPFDAGGLSDTQDAYYVLGALGPDDAVGLWAWGAMMACLVAVMAGVAVRPALLIGVLLYAQLGHLHPGGDRGIDRILRTVLLVILVSGSAGVSPWRRGAPILGNAWAMSFLRFLLVDIYLSAGIGKVGQQPRWLSFEGLPVLYRVMCDPMAAHLDARAWFDWPLPFQIGGMGAVLLELSSPLILTRFAPWWALVGVSMHIGIFLTMDLGMFSWGMLAIYPVLFSPWISRWMSRERGT